MKPRRSRSKRIGDPRPVTLADKLARAAGDTAAKVAGRVKDFTTAPAAKIRTILFHGGKN